MKKLGQALLTGVILTSGILFGTSDAFAMGSKGDIDFSTDANTYYRSATSIDVSGYAPHSNGCVVELISKDGNTYRRIDVEFEGDKHFDVSFPTRGLPTGLYDVQVNQDWASHYYHGELTNYIKVNY